MTPADLLMRTHNYLTLIQAKTGNCFCLTNGTIEVTY